MTVQAPASHVPLTRGNRVRWAIEDSIVIFKRNLISMPRMLDVVTFSVIQPVTLVLLFAYVFGGSIRLPGGGSYREFLMPGVFVQTLAFVSAATAVGVAADMQKGLVDRFRSLPMARSAVLSGRTLADLALTVFRIIVISLCGVLVGWRVHEGFPKGLLAFALLLFFSYALSWVGALIGLAVREPEAATQAVLVWLFPLTFISNAFVPPQGMPQWLQYVAEWNPVSATVAATRQLWGNPGVPVIHPSWVTDHPVAMSAIYSLVILVIALPLCVRKYRVAVRH